MNTEKKITKNRPPFGFTWQDSELVQVKEEVPIYAELFELYLIHKRKQTVARILNEQGYRTRTGKKFTFTAVDRLLRNPTAKGIYSYSVCEPGTGINKQHEMRISPIVSKETWSQAQAIMASQKGKQTRSATQDVFLGKVYCGCEQPMEILSKSLNYSCHKCNSEIPIDDVHAIFEKSIEDIPFPDQKTLDNLAGNKHPNSTSAIKSKISKLEHDIEKLFELHSAEAISLDIFKQRHEKLNTQLNGLNQTLSKLDQKPIKTYDSLLAYWHSIDTKTQHLIADIILHDLTLKSNVAAISLYPLFNFAQQVHVRGV